MPSRADARRDALAVLVTAALALLLAAGALVSEFLQAPGEGSDQAHGLRSLLGGFDAGDAAEVVLQNRSGVFRFRREGGADGGRWTMTEPRRLPADGEALGSLVASLADADVRGIHPDDPINRSNYRLDEPLAQLTLEFPEGSRTARFGLVNPIDDTTYVHVEGDDAIYRVGAPARPPGSLDAADLVDRRVFTVPPEEVESIAIYEGGGTGRRPLFRMSRGDDGWTDARDRPLDADRARDRLARLAAIRSSLVLEGGEGGVGDRVDRLLARPTYLIDIRNRDRTARRYKVVSVSGGFPGLPADPGRRSFIVKAVGQGPLSLIDREPLMEVIPF